MVPSYISSKSRFISTYSFLLILLSETKSNIAAASSCFKSIIAFGDSITDTGNLLHLDQSDPPIYFSLPPYGETFFGHPTGRCSDGRLIIDFIAEYLGLPLVPPFYGGGNLSSGSSVNFATASANALPDSYLVRRGVEVREPNISLGNQLNWFKELYLPKFYPNSSDREKFLKASLVIVGEIGGNDYNHAFMGGESEDMVKEFVPKVIKVISATINEVIKLGGVTLMVPGNFPIGCSVAYLSKFKTSNAKDYDPNTGCIIWLNDFARYHNLLLQSELRRIRKESPHTTIIYADYYNAAMDFYHSPHDYGFRKGGLAACCPRCVQGGSESCENPSEYVSWDGVHFTEAAYKLVATSVVRGSRTIPQLRSSCPLSVLSDH